MNDKNTTRLPASRPIIVPAPTKDSIPPHVILRWPDASEIAWPQGTRWVLFQADTNTFAPAKDQWLPVIPVPSGYPKPPPSQQHRVPDYKINRCPALYKNDEPIYYTTMDKYDRAKIYEDRCFVKHFLGIQWSCMNKVQLSRTDHAMLSNGVVRRSPAGYGTAATISDGHRDYILCQNFGRLLAGGVYSRDLDGLRDTYTQSGKPWLAAIDLMPLRPTRPLQGLQIEAFMKMQTRPATVQIRATRNANSCSGLTLKRPRTDESDNATAREGSSTRPPPPPLNYYTRGGSISLDSVSSQSSAEGSTYCATEDGQGVAIPRNAETQTVSPPPSVKSSSRIKAPAHCGFNSGDFTSNLNASMSPNQTAASSLFIPSGNHLAEPEGMPLQQYNWSARTADAIKAVLSDMGTPISIKNFQDAIRERGQFDAEFLDFIRCMKERLIPNLLFFMCDKEKSMTFPAEYARAWYESSKRKVKHLRKVLEWVDAKDTGIIRRALDNHDQQSVVDLVFDWTECYGSDDLGCMADDLWKLRDNKCRLCLGRA